MSNFNVNITPNDVMNQLEKENQKKVFTTFNPNNYLNTRLSANETSKTLTIRLLPPNSQGGFPFEPIHMHTVKVSKEVSESGWKNFVCPTHNHMGNACPFCSLSEEAKKMKNSTSNEQEKKRYQEIETLNRAKQMWVVRCIERGHEDDGVKFWLVPNSKDGAYAKIMGVWNTRWKKAQEKGQVNNIFDLNNGKDLDVTITRSADGKTVFSIVDADEKTPLTDDFNKGVEWINDTKKWSDVYRVKPYEYMEVVASGGVPVFSKDKNKYVDRDEENAEKKEKEMAELQESLTPTFDYSKMPMPENIMEEAFTTASNDTDDLPF